MRIALAQINTTVGDIEGNLSRALDYYAKAQAAAVSLVIFPEQTFPGYPAKDLLLSKSLIKKNEGALYRFAEMTKDGPAAIIGFAESHKSPGNGLYNSIAFCENGKINCIYRKWLLPTYDVFDEDRYFDVGSEIQIIDIEGMKLALTICEDIWNDDLYWSQRRYEVDPIRDAAAAGAELILNISASPFTSGKRNIRKEMLSSSAARYDLPIIQVNLVGANDDIIFDGVSTAYDDKGKLVAQSKSFEEDLLILDVERDSQKRLSVHGTIETDEEELEILRRAIVLGIKDYVKKCGFHSVLIGLSGGIDSALTAALAADALGGENVHGVAMPSRFSSDHSIRDAESLANNLEIKFDTIPIENFFSAAIGTLEENYSGNLTNLAKENLQARIRGTILMTLSNSTNSLVLTTGNKSELSVGYCTLYGDMCGALAPIADLPKLVVYELSRYINSRAGRDLIPANTIEKPPSAELAPNQLDSDSLPPYEILDPIVLGYVEENKGFEELVSEGFDPEIVRRILHLININEYKRRQAAPALKVTSRAFGFGWRMPIAKGRII